jgi:hypothetical protein
MADSECRGHVALVSEVAFAMPADNLDLPSAEATPDEVNISPIAVSIKSSLVGVLRASLGPAVTADSVTILSIRAGSLVVDYRVDVPLEAATEENQARAVAAVSDPTTVGLPATAMDVTVLDAKGDEVVAAGAVQQAFRTFSYTQASTCPAGMQPGVDSSDCSSACDFEGLVAPDVWTCNEDGAPVAPLACVAAGLGEAPSTDVQCCPPAEEASCRGSDEEAAGWGACLENLDGTDGIECLAEAWKLEVWQVVLIVVGGAAVVMGCFFAGCGAFLAKLKSCCCGGKQAANDPPPPMPPRGSALEAPPIMPRGSMLEPPPPMPPAGNPEAVLPVVMARPVGDTGYHSGAQPSAPSAGQLYRP